MIKNDKWEKKNDLIHALTSQMREHKCFHKGLAHLMQTLSHLQKWRHLQTHIHSYIDYKITYAHNAIHLIKRSVIAHYNCLLSTANQTLIFCIMMYTL